MDQKLREAIGILRHQIISPVLMESGRGQLAYFKQLESRDFDVPGKGPEKLLKVVDEGLGLRDDRLLDWGMGYHDSIFIFNTV